MLSRFLKLVLSTTAVLVLGASAAVLFVPTRADAVTLVRNGNYLYNLQWQKVGCAAIEPPYDCTWSS